jgi:hypothetical protein
MIKVLVALLLAGVASTSGGGGQAGTPTPASGDVPVVLELFTSEGCSSCPPADRLLIELTGKQPIKGALVIGIGEHVDYWDHQGWKDPFSDRLFSQRQTVYANAGGSNDIYTPQIIVDGIDTVVGHDRRAVFDAIRRAAGRKKPAMALEWSADTSKLAVTVGTSRETVDATVFLAITEDGLRTSVKRGENAGRTLDHAAVARRLTQVGKTDSDGSFSSVVPLALAPGWNRQALRIVVFVQVDKTRRIAAAATSGV